MVLGSLLHREVRWLQVAPVPDIRHSGQRQAGAAGGVKLQEGARRAVRGRANSTPPRAGGTPSLTTKCPFASRGPGLQIPLAPPQSKDQFRSRNRSFLILCSSGYPRISPRVAVA